MNDKIANEKKNAQYFASLNLFRVYRKSWPIYEFKLTLTYYTVLQNSLLAIDEEHTL